MGRLAIYAAEALQAVIWRIAPQSRMAHLSSRLFLKAFMRFYPWQAAHKDAYDAYLRDQHKQ